ncbi:MAG: rhomboid family intramembrane serine protease [Opitutae bacterium]|nr:rhomboid family intramembrane serine protease [Opitutae bacterium]
MLSDRQYMGDEYYRKTTSAYIWVIAVLLAAFGLELILLSPWLGASGAALVSQLPLTVGSLKSWRLWTLLSHSLLHSTANPLPVLFTVIALGFIGRELEPRLGAGRFLAVFGGAILSGALMWTAVNWSHGGAHIGSGAGLLGLFIVLAGLSPHLEMGLFLLPVTFRLQHVVYLVLALDVFGLFFYEILGSQAPLGLTPSAHLGGMLAGWLYARFMHDRQGLDGSSGLKLPSWTLRWRKAKPTAANRPASSSGRSTPQIRAEVDRILDKINSEGFGALTPQEKRVLDEAKDLLNRH